MSDLGIRQARASDLDTIVAFNAALARETEGRALDPGVLTEGVRRVLGDPARGVYWLAERGGKVVGQTLVTFEWSDWRNGWLWWVQSVYVAPQARGGGVYRALHAHVCDQARAAGDVCGVRLYVDDDNAAARTVYERLGMTLTHYRLYETDWSGAPRRSAPPAG